MADSAPFDPQQLQILLVLVGDRDAEEVLRHAPDPVREQLRTIEKKLKAQLAEPTAAANPHEDLVRKTFADQWWYSPQMPLDEVLLRARSRLRHDHDEKCSIVVDLRQLRSRLAELESSRIREAICHLIDSKFREGLTPCASSFVDVIELPGDTWRGLWRVTVWGPQGEIAADVDVEVAGEIDALDKALAAFVARTVEEWHAEMPTVFGDDGSK